MNLQDWKKEHKLEPLAKKVGVTYQYVRLLAVGLRNPSPELRQRITEATDGLVTFEEENDGDSDA